MLKIHKPGCPLRIIVSSVNSSLHSFETFLHNIIYDSIPNSHDHINNSFDLVDKFTGLHIDDYYRLISLDVISLFTNIHFDLTIESIHDLFRAIISNKMWLIVYVSPWLSLILPLDTWNKSFTGFSRKERINPGIVGWKHYEYLYFVQQSRNREPQETICNWFTHNILSLLNNHYYISDIREITEFSNNVIEYIAGYIVKQFKKNLFCENCLNVLTARKK